MFRKEWGYVVIVLSFIAQAFAWGPLERGDEIRIVAPSRGVSEEHVEAVRDLVLRAGYKPLFSDCMVDYEYSKENPRANTDAKRAEDFMNAWQSGVKVIWAICGGSGAVNVVDHMERVNFDPTTVERKPTIVGFSDITNLHLWAAKYGIPSMHGMNAGQGMEMEMFSKVNLGSSLTRFMMSFPEIEKPGLSKTMHLELLNDKSQFKAFGGKILGGCFSIVQRNIGTPTQLNPEGAILLF